MRIHRSLLWLALLASLVSFIAVSRPTLHHWDEFAYVYAAQQYSIQSLVNGEFESSNVPGFFNVKIGHIAVLKATAGFFGDGPTRLLGYQLFYGALIVLTGLMVAGVMVILHRTQRPTVWLAAGIYLLVPVNVYLCGKILAETPAAFCAMLAVMTLALAVRSEAPIRRITLCGLSALALVASMYTRVNFLLLPVGFVMALVLVPPEGLTRRGILWTSALVGILAGVAFAVAELVLELRLLDGLGVASVVSGQTLSLRAKLWKIAYAFGPFALILAACIPLVRDRSVAFYLTWLACASLPMVLAFSYFEVRWLSVGAPALAALGFLCLHRLSTVLSDRGRSTTFWRSGTVAGAAFVVAIASNVFIQPRTESGFSSKEFSEAMAWADKQYPGHAVLVPWGWTIYHYMRVAYPTAPTYLVNNWTFFSPQMQSTDATSWVAALREWYGPAYIGSLNELLTIKQRPFIAIAFNRPDSRWNDLDKSWIADDSRLTKTAVHREGDYVIYLIEGDGHLSHEARPTSPP